MWAHVSSGDGFDEFFFSAVVTLDQLQQEVFYLGYHLHWSPPDILDLDILDRREYVRLLVNAIERQNQAMEDARRNAR